MYHRLPSLLFIFFFSAAGRDLELMGDEKDTWKVKTLDEILQEKKRRRELEEKTEPKRLKNVGWVLCFRCSLFGGTKKLGIFSEERTLLLCLHMLNNCLASSSRYLVYFECLGTWKSQVSQVRVIPMLVLSQLFQVRVLSTLGYDIYLTSAVSRPSYIKS